jgi:uncharacterized damage-inducible protein DinB
MTLEEIRTLLDYHYWARDRMLEAAEQLTPAQYTKDLGNSFRSVRDTIVHTYSAEWIWYSRWTGSSPDAFPSPEDFPDVAAIRAAWKAQQEKVRLFVGTVGEKNVEKVFDYKLMNGQAASSVFTHMLRHVVNHATYHRGQVTTMLRQLGAAPPKSQDMIVFYRERAQSRRD